jgi:hypothetical protein
MCEISTIMQCALASVPESVCMWLFGLLGVRLMNMHNPTKKINMTSQTVLEKRAKCQAREAALVVEQLPRSHLAVVFLVLLFFFRQYQALPRM